MSAESDNEQPQTNDTEPASAELDAIAQGVSAPLAPAPSNPKEHDTDPHPQPLPTMGREADGAHAQSPAPDATPEWEPRVLTLPLSPAQAAAAREAERRLRLEPWLTEVFARMATTQPLSDRELHALRVLSDLLALWALCEAPACRREGTCRGSEPHCFGDVGDLVPVCALPFLAGFVAGQLDRLPFDAMLARLPRGTLQHWFAWHAAVAQITGRASRHGAAGGAW